MGDGRIPGYWALSSVGTGMALTTAGEKNGIQSLVLNIIMETQTFIPEIGRRIFQNFSRRQ